MSCVGGGLTLEDVDRRGLGEAAGWPSVPALRADRDRHARKGLRGYTLQAIERADLLGVDLAEEAVLRLYVEAARRDLADPEAAEARRSQDEEDRDAVEALLAADRLDRALRAARVRALHEGRLAALAAESHSWRNEHRRRTVRRLTDPEPASP